MKTKNFAIRLVALLSVFTLTLSGCGDKPAPTDESIDTAETSEAPVTLSAEELALLDELPEKDFDSYEFRIMSPSSWTANYTREEENDEVVNDAIIKRNRAVEERFNVKIKVIDTGTNGTTANIDIIRNSVLAGTDDYDLAALNSVYIAQSSVEGLYTNLREIPYLNFEKPWWISTPSTS